MPNDLAVRRDDATLVDPGVFQQAWQLAQAMAGAKSLPQHLQGSAADCLRVVEMAFRTGQSPYAIADKTYFVQGKIAFEGQLCAALINAHPLIDQRLNYEYEGAEDKPETLVCTISARLRGEEKPRTVKVSWKNGESQSRGAKEKWKSQPAQQLAYLGARVWGRRHAPEVLMGIYTPEELEGETMRDVTPARSAPPAPTRNADPIDDIIAANQTPHDPDTGEVREEEGANGAQSTGQYVVWLSEKQPQARFEKGGDALAALAEAMRKANDFGTLGSLQHENDWLTKKAPKPLRDEVNDVYRARFKALQEVQDSAASNEAGAPAPMI